MGVVNSLVDGAYSDTAQSVMHSICASTVVHQDRVVLNDVSRVESGVVYGLTSARPFAIIYYNNAARDTNCARLA